MRSAVTLTAFLLLVSCSRGGPENGAQASFQELPSGGPWKQTIRFRGGERACVFAKGHLERSAGNDASGVLRIAIYDAAGKLVVSNPDTLGYAVVFWYPPRTADYEIQIHNSSGQEKRVYVCIK